MSLVCVWASRCESLLYTRATPSAIPVLLYRYTLLMNMDPRACSVSILLMASMASLMHYTLSAFQRLIVKNAAPITGLGAPRS